VLPLALALVLTVDRPFAALVDPLWLRCEKPKMSGSAPGSHWEWALTPPLPSEWPLTPGGRLVHYAYGREIDPRMDYAERSGSVFARVDVPKSGEPRASATAQKMDWVGAQSIHSLTPAELEAHRKAFDAAPHLWAGSLDAVRAPYCTWIKNNGGIVSRVQDAHQAFFKALGCR
jgi:hypothetical protein